MLSELYQVVSSDIYAGRSEIRNIVGAIWRYPVKLLALFVFSPFITIGVIWRSGRPLRRVIALAGLLLAWWVVWGVGSWLATWGSALLIMSHVSILVGVGFVIGTYTSAIIVVMVQLFLFNTITTMFLKMSSADVLAYLSEQMADVNKTSPLVDPKAGVD